MKRWKVKWSVALTLGVVFCSVAGTQLIAEPESDQPDGREKRRKRMMRRMMRDDGAPKVGEAAPPFKLKSLDKKKEVDLAGFRNDRPVILFFGSYT